MNAPEAAVARVQEALRSHIVNWRPALSADGEWSCSCGEHFGRAEGYEAAQVHSAVAAADAAVAPIAAQTLRDYANDLGANECAMSWSLREHVDDVREYAETVEAE